MGDSGLVGMMRALGLVSPMRNLVLVQGSSLCCYIGLGFVNIMCFIFLLAFRHGGFLGLHIWKRGGSLSLQPIQIKIDGGNRLSLSEHQF